MDNRVVSKRGCRKAAEDSGLYQAIGRVLAGEVDAYESIYRVCDQPLRAFVAARYGRLGIDFVEEVALRTHERVLEKLSSYDPDRGASFQSWMNWQALSVARRVKEEWFGISRVRDKEGRRRDVVRLESFDEKLHAEYVPTVLSPEEERERRERNRLLWQEFNRLSELGRLSIAGYDLEGWTFSQTAVRLGRGYGTVWRERRRALAILRERLQGLGIGPAERSTVCHRVVRFYGGNGAEEWRVSVAADLPESGVSCGQDG